MSTVVSEGSASQSTAPLASIGATLHGITLPKSASDCPPMLARLASTETRVRTMLNHWNQVPFSPAGSSPIFAYCSATQTEAINSSMVPPSRPRIAGEAIAKRSRRRSASRISRMARGTGGASDVAGACAESSAGRTMSAATSCFIECPFKCSVSANSRSLHPRPSQAPTRPHTAARSRAP